jgi:hypothetical protein
VLFLATAVGLLLAALVEAPGLTLFGFGLIALGVPAYEVARRTSGPASPRTLPA